MDDFSEPSRAGSADALLLAFGRSALAAAREEIGALRKSAEPDQVHRARAAGRRLRTVLRLFRPGWKRELRPFRQSLRRLSRALGKVRDLDVFAGTIHDLRAKAGDDAAALLAWAESERERAQHTLATLAETDDPLAGLAGWFASAGERPPGQRPRRAGRIIDRAWRALRRRGRDIDRLGAHGRHEVRIRARRLQIVLEILAPRVFPPASEGDAAFRRKLARLQRRLGDLNDLATASRLLDQFRQTGDHPPAKTVRKALEARTRRLKRKAATDFAAMEKARKAGAWPPVTAPAPALDRLRETT
jgi:CHAD domain-containing protein